LNIPANCTAILRRWGNEPFSGAKTNTWAINFPTSFFFILIFGRENIVDPRMI